MTAATIYPKAGSEILTFVEQNSGQPVKRCFQCAKCTSGCPTAYAMDLTPRQVMRAVQLGLEQELVNSSAIWLCLSCKTCAIRCPVEIDVSQVMGAIRQRAQSQGIQPAQPSVAAFHRLFLDGIRQAGRVNEFMLGARHNMATRNLFANASLLPALMSRGKLPMMTRSIRGLSEVQAIFQHVAEMEAGEPGQEAHH
ncbi:MAG: 4Fe-4S dicluster domain-containing protein [Chloroflexota bacterium]|nr:MAG: 4Fe-4S dicluster domain-containing protein [Chloroflexota bacterium]